MQFGNFALLLITTRTWRGPRSGPLHIVRPTSTVACFYSAPMAWNLTAVDTPLFL